MTATDSEPKRKESDVYDRQIRLWGAEAQEKMAKSKVLYIHVTGLTSEILKNLVLAGIRAAICDERIYPNAIQDTPSFFITDADRNNDTYKKAKHTVADIIRPKIEELNPLLGECEIINKNVSELTDDILKEYTIVIASRITITDAIRISKITVNNGGKFYMADCFGYNGVATIDLGINHTYRPELGKKLLDVTNLKQYVDTETIFNVPLHDAINRFHKIPPPLWVQYRCLLEYVTKNNNNNNNNQWPTTTTIEDINKDDFINFITKFINDNNNISDDHVAVSNDALQKLALTCTSEIAPVCSVLGGILGNEVIKAISGKGEPANNTLLFDGTLCKAWTFLVKPKE